MSTASASISARSSAASRTASTSAAASSTRSARIPVLAKVKLVGEPWDIGPGGYQVGGFPPGWAEWNDKYRDTVRDYWKDTDGITATDFAARLTGSGDVYDQRGRRPWASVNFITAHDGFTLNDLVSYNEKHNEANGEDNKDGHGDNRSFNYGAEGPTDDEAIMRCASGRSAISLRRCCCRTARRCCLPATSSAAARAATTTAIARTARSAGCTGRTCRDSARGADAPSSAG